MKPKNGQYKIEEKGYTCPKAKRKHELEAMFGYESEEEEEEE